MSRFASRWSAARLLIAAGAAVLATGCDFHYRAAADPAMDEVVVRAVPSGEGGYDHPARLSARDLASILQDVRVQFKSNWLQRLITGTLQPVPLFERPVLERLAPVLAEAFEKAGTRERIVFYVAQRRSNDRRDVTSGTLFVKGPTLTIALANHQNRVDVVPGLTAYDRKSPEVAVAPQRFSLVFERNEFVIDRRGDAVEEILGAAPPMLQVDYARFLQFKSRAAAAPGFPWSPGTPVP